MKKQLICISCPVGCHLEAGQGPDGKWLISGNRCPRGPVYAESELTDPRRLVTAVVHSNSKLLPCLPVRTAEPIPKRLIGPLLNRLYQLQISVPVKRGEVLLESVEDTGIPVIFSADCEK